MSTPVPPPGLYREPSLGAPAFIPTPPPQASDPAVLANGQVVARPVVPAPAGDGGAFSIDLERAPQVLRDLEDARMELVDVRREVFRLGKVDPGTSDQVSLDAAAALEVVAVGGNGSLLEAVSAGISRLDELIAATRTELSAYRAGDRKISDQFDARS